MNMNEWAALAAAVHTLCLALGMTFYFLTNEVLSSACSDSCRQKLHSTVVSLLHFVATFCGAAAFFHTIQMWLAYASSHGMGLSKRVRALATSMSRCAGMRGVSPSASAVAVATGSYTIAFLIGCLLAEGQSSTCYPRPARSAALSNSRRVLRGTCGCILCVL